jgi:hypothetical protein
MTIRLAHNPILLSAGDITVRLRPCLRAGLLMAQKHSLQELQERIWQCHLGVISHLVAIGCDDIDKTESLIAAQTIPAGLHKLQDFFPELIEFIRLSFGLSDDESTYSDEPATGEPIDFIAEFTDLFEFATGWLGWTPETAWAATPAEIIIARKGHFSMLRAIHGNGEDAENHDPRDLPSQSEVQASIASLKAMLI